MLENTSYVNSCATYQCFEFCCPKTSSCASNTVIHAMKSTHIRMSVPSVIKIEIGSKGGPSPRLYCRLIFA